MTQKHILLKGVIAKRGVYHRMNKMTEKQFENKIKAYLNALPNTWFFKVWGGGFQSSGIPDIIACVNGHFVAIEVKAENGKPSPLQLHHIRQINDVKGIGLIVKPSEFEFLKSKLDELLGD